MLDKDCKIVLTKENQEEVLGILQKLGYKWVGGDLPLDFLPFTNGSWKNGEYLYIECSVLCGYSGCSPMCQEITLEELRGYLDLDELENSKGRGMFIKKFSETDGMKVGNFVLKSDDSFIDVILNTKYGKPKNIFRVSSRSNTCNRNSLKDLENFGFKIEMKKDKISKKTLKILAGFMAHEEDYMYQIRETSGIKYIKVFVGDSCAYNTILLDPKDDICKESGELEKLLKESEVC